MEKISIRVDEFETFIPFKKDPSCPKLQVCKVYWMEPVREHKGYKFLNSCDDLLSFHKYYENDKSFNDYSLFIGDKEVDISEMILLRIIIVITEPLLYNTIDCSRFLYYISSGEIVTVFNHMTKESKPIREKEIKLLDVIAFVIDEEGTATHLAMCVGKLSNGEYLFLNKFGIGDVGFCTLKEILVYLKRPLVRFEKVLSLCDEENNQHLHFQ